MNVEFIAQIFKMAQHSPSGLDFQDSPAPLRYLK